MFCSDLEQFRQRSCEPEAAVCGRAAVPGKATLMSPAGTVTTTAPTFTLHAVSIANWYFQWVNDGSGGQSDPPVHRGPGGKSIGSGHLLCDASDYFAARCGPVVGSDL